MTFIRKIVNLLLLAILPVVLSVASAMAQETAIYPGQTTQLHEEPVPGASYTWELYRDSTVNFAVVPGDCPATDAFFPGGNNGPTVNVTWLKPGIYFFKVTAVDVTGCTNNLKIGRIKVEKELAVAVLEVNPDSVCVGDWAELKVSFTGIAPWSFVLEADNGTDKTTTSYTDIGKSPYLIPVGPTTTTQYRIISITDVNGTNYNPSGSVTLEVSPLPRSSRIYLKYY